MDAVEYLKTLRRLCKSQERCPGCVLYNKEDSCCIADIGESAEDAVQIVEKWAKSHPVKTRQSELLKMFPKAAVRDDIISICPLFYCVNFLGTNFKGYCQDNRANCNKCCREYWLAEVTDND